MVAVHDRIDTSEAWARVHHQVSLLEARKDGVRRDLTAN